MSAPQAPTPPTPKPEKSWTCPKCGTSLGRVTSKGDLVVVAYAQVFYPAGSIRCFCGHLKRFDGRRIIIDVPAKGKAA